MINLGCAGVDGSEENMMEVITSTTTTRDKIKRDKYLKVVKNLLDM